MILLKLFQRRYPLKRLPAHGCGDSASARANSGYTNAPHLLAKRIPRREGEMNIKRTSTLLDKSAPFFPSRIGLHSPAHHNISRRRRAQRDERRPLPFVRTRDSGSPYANRRLSLSCLPFPSFSRPYFTLAPSKVLISRSLPLLCSLLSFHSAFSSALCSSFLVYSLFLRPFFHKD